MNRRCQSGATFSQANSVMSWCWLTLLLAYSSALTAEPGVLRKTWFGYTALDSPGAVEAASAAGIPISLGTLIYRESDWDSVETKAILERYEQASVKAGVSVAGFLYETIEDPTSPCFNGSIRLIFRLRQDWKARLDDWWALHGAHLHSSRLAYVSANDEVNNLCSDLGEVDLLAKTLQAYFPHTPIAMAWGRTDVEGGPMALPAPPWIPESIDWVGIWSYGIYDPLDPSHPKNANPDFYSPAIPIDRGTAYGGLLSKLHDHQRVVVVFDSHFQNRVAGVHQELGWEEPDIGQLTRNYYGFVQRRPEVVALFGFTWGTIPGSLKGMEDLMAEYPEVLDAQRDVGCLLVRRPNSCQAPASPTP